MWQPKIIEMTGDSGKRRQQNLLLTQALYHHSQTFKFSRYQMCPLTITSGIVYLGYHDRCVHKESMGLYSKPLAAGFRMFPQCTRTPRPYIFICRYCFLFWIWFSTDPLVWWVNWIHDGFLLRLLQGPLQQTHNKGIITWLCSTVKDLQTFSMIVMSGWSITP